MMRAHIDCHMRRSQNFFRIADLSAQRFELAQLIEDFRAEGVSFVARRALQGVDESFQF